MELLFMKPYCKEVLWGGTKLAEKFGYETEGDHTGEAWVVAANKNGVSTVTEGEYAGKTLTELWNEHRELFNNMQGEEFPLLVKLIDARDDLSIQVHPDDAYAKVNENCKGKTECWYIVDCDEGADIVTGHKAQTKEELKKLVEEKRWSELLNIRPIKKGDFFFISSGTVHAIRKGTLILEIQQNSDITYRLYDYDRLQNGKPRELHTAKSLDVITCPQELKDTREAEKIYRGQKSQVLVDCPLFTVTKHMVSGADEVVIDNPYDFLIVNVLEGTGSVDGRKIKPGDSFIAPYGYRKLAFSGTLTFMTSHV